MNVTCIDRPVIKILVESGHAISTTNWGEINRATDTQQAFDLFHNRLTELYNRHFPKVRINNKYNNRKPWLSEGLKNSIRHRNELYVKSKKIISVLNEELYEELYKLIRENCRNSWEWLKSIITMVYLLNIAMIVKRSWGIIKHILNRNHEPQNTYSKQIENWG